MVWWKLFQQLCHENGGSLTFRRPATAAAGFGTAGDAAPATWGWAEGEAAIATLAATNLGWARQPGPNHVATGAVTDLHVHWVGHWWWSPLVLEDLRLLPFKDRQGPKSAVLTGRSDPGRLGVPKQLFGGDSNTEDLWMRGGLETVVGDQRTPVIQDILGRNQDAGVGPHGIAWDVSIEVQGLASVQLKGAWCENRVRELGVRYAAVFHLGRCGGIEN